MGEAEEAGGEGGTAERQGVAQADTVGEESGVGQLVSRGRWRQRCGEESRRRRVREEEWQRGGCRGRGRDRRSRAVSILREKAIAGERTRDVHCWSVALNGHKAACKLARV